MSIFNSLNTRILAWFLGLILITGITVGYSSYVIFYDTLVEKQKESLLFAVQTETQHLLDHIKIRKTKFKSIVMSENVLRYSEQFSEILLFGYFDKFKDQFPVLSFINKKGDEELRIDNGINSTHLINIHNSILYKKLLDKPNKIITLVGTSIRTGAPELAIGYHRENFFGTFEGIIISMIPFSNIFKTVSEVTIGKTGYLILLDDKANVLVQPETVSNLEKIIVSGENSENIINQAIRSETGFGRANIMGMDSFVAFAPVKGKNWSMIAVLPYSEFIAAPTELRNTYLAILLIILLIGVISSLYMTSAITKPIIKLTRISESLAKGNLSQRIEVDSHDEIGQLGHSFNSMAKNLESSKTELTEIAKKREQLLEELEIKHQDLLLKEQEQAEILHSMVAAVITIDETGIILSFNSSAETLFGYTTQEILGQNINKLMPDTISKKHDSYVTKYCETGEAKIIGSGRNIEGLHKDNSFIPLHLSIAELAKGPDGKRRFIGSCLDLTHVKRQEEQLRRSQKMEALGKLTGGIAHDYNNMLGVILGYTDLLDNALTGQSELLSYIDNINHAAKRSTKLTKRLLAFSRHRSFESTVLNINTLIEDQKLMLEKTLTARINLIFDLDSKLKPVELDSGDLEDSIVNLCINAMHAMKDGGELTIQTRNKTLDTKDVDLLNLSPGEYVLLSITDNGCGMTNKIKEKIFDPFFTTKGDSGTGLGLSQVYGFVKRSLGTIKVYSEPEHGSRFLLFFPSSNKQISEVIPPKEQDSTNLKGTETILVVDDEVTMLNLAYDVLHLHGYHVLTANDGEEALEIIKTENVNLLITDVIMPNMDGYELAGIVQEYYPRIKIQMVSGFSDGRHENMTEDSLYRNMLNKPYESRKLLRRLRLLLDQNKDEITLVDRHILIMDDDEDVRQLFKLHLLKLGCKVIETHNGEEALTAYQDSLNNHSPIDAMILDLSIPGGMGGKELVNKIRAIDQNVKLIVSSGDSEGLEMNQYNDYGFDAALDKTFNRETLKQLLEKIFSSH